MIRLRLYTDANVFPQHIIKWKIEPTSENLSLYVLDLYASEVENSEFVIITSGINLYTTQSYTYTIPSGLYYHGFRKWVYSGVVRNTSTNATRGTNVTTIDQQADKITQEIIRRKTLAFPHRYMGEPFYLLSHRTWGTSCANCWDETLQKRLIEKCPVCYDTAWSGGYYTPEAFQATISVGDLRDQLTFWGDWRQGDAEIRFPNYPSINLKDVIVDESNIRWNVVNISYVAKSGAIITQRAHLRRIPFDDIVYQFSIPEFNEEGVGDYEH